MYIKLIRKKELKDNGIRKVIIIAFSGKITNKDISNVIYGLKLYNFINIIFPNLINNYFIIDF